VSGRSGDVDRVPEEKRFIVGSPFRREEPYGQPSARLMDSQQAHGLLFVFSFFSRNEGDDLAKGRPILSSKARAASDDGPFVPLRRREQGVGGQSGRRRQGNLRFASAPILGDCSNDQGKLVRSTCDVDDSLTSACRKETVERSKEPKGARRCSAGIARSQGDKIPTGLLREPVRET